MKMRYFIIFLALFCRTLQGFSTLQQAHAYARSHPEYVQSETHNPLNPSFKSFFEKRRENLLTNLFSLLGLQKKSSEFIMFSKLLKEVNALMLKLETSHKNDIFAFNPKPQSSFIMYGPLYGAFHSFVRTLTQLKKQGIIDEHFTLLKPNHYFVFLGNAIDRSSYNLATLSLIFRLIIQNPGHVFYLQGPHERNKYWYNFSTAQELKNEAHKASLKKVPLRKDLNNFFSKLPLALFLRCCDQEEHERFVQISNYGLYDNNLLSSESIAHHLLNMKDETGPQHFILNEPQCDKNFVPIEALFKAEVQEYDYVPTTGLRLTIPEKGATTRTLFSAPTKTFIKHYEFHHDTFCILKTDKHLEQWKVELYNRDVSQNDETFECQRSAILSGEKRSSSDAQHSTLPPLNVGSLLDFSREAAIYGRPLALGMSLRINKANRENEIGRRIKLTILNHEYTTSIALKKTEDLLNYYDTSILLSAQGSSIQKALLTFFEQGKIISLFPNTGSSDLRAPHVKNMIHYRASYAQEVEDLISYAADRLKTTSFAFFYQDDSYGLDGLKGAHQALQNLGIKKWAEAPYHHRGLDISKSAHIISEFTPQTIVCIANPLQAQQLIHALGIENLANTTFLAVSKVTNLFRTFLKGIGLNVTFSQVVPNPQTDQSELAQEFRDEMIQAGYKNAISPLAFEGYINASILIEALKRIDIHHITKEKILEQLESMTSINLKGIPLGFNPETRSFCQKVWIDSEQGPWMIREHTTLHASL